MICSAMFVYLSLTYQKTSPPYLKYTFEYKHLLKTEIPQTPFNLSQIQNALP